MWTDVYSCVLIYVCNEWRLFFSTYRSWSRSGSCMLFFVSYHSPERWWQNKHHVTTAGVTYMPYYHKCPDRKKVDYASHTSQQENTYSGHGNMYLIHQCTSTVRFRTRWRRKVNQTKQNIISEKRISTDETIAVQVKLYSLEQKQDNSQTQIMSSRLLQENVIGLANTKTLIFSVPIKWKKNFVVGWNICLQRHSYMQFVRRHKMIRPVSPNYSVQHFVTPLASLSTTKLIDASLPNR